MGERKLTIVITDKDYETLENMAKEVTCREKDWLAGTEREISSGWDAEDVVLMIVKEWLENWKGIAQV